MPTGGGTQDCEQWRLCLRDALRAIEGLDRDPGPGPHGTNYPYRNSPLSTTDADGRPIFSSATALGQRNINNWNDLWLTRFDAEVQRLCPGLPYPLVQAVADLTRLEVRVWCDGEEECTDPRCLSSSTATESRCTSFMSAYGQNDVTASQLDTVVRNHESCRPRLPEALRRNPERLFHRPLWHDGVFRIWDPPPIFNISIPARIEWARQRAMRALSQAEAIVRAGRGAMTDDQRRALDCWFPGATDAQLAEMASIFERTRIALDGARISYYPQRLDASISSDPDAVEHNFAIDGGENPGQTFNYPPGVEPGPGRPWRADRYIALYPVWAQRPAWGASVVLHEGFHYADRRFEGHEVGYPYNATQWHGFVSDLTGMPYNRDRTVGRDPRFPGYPPAAGCAEIA